MYGPRQGVYTFHQFPLRPHSQQLWQWSQVHHSVKWRQSQFKNPDECYKYRCRPVPQDPSQPVTQSTSVSRPSSASHIRPSSASHIRPSSSIKNRGPQRSTSVVSLSSSRSSNRLSTRPGVKEQHRRSSTNNSRNNLTSTVTKTKQAWTPALQSSASAPQFSLLAQPITIRPRPLQKLNPQTSDEKSSSSDPPFLYPDPLTITGDPSFEDRLAELAQYECDTIRHEEAMRRYSTPLLARPSSAKNIRQTASKTKVQSVQRVNRNGSNKEQRTQFTSLRSHRGSLVHNSFTTKTHASTQRTTNRSNPSTHISTVGRTNKGTDIPQSQTKNHVVSTDSGKDTAPGPANDEQHCEPDVSICTDNVQKESHTNTCCSGIESDTELSCSPPIVYITSLPSYEAKVESATRTAEVHHPSVINAWSDDNPVTEPEPDINNQLQAMDDLQATSDLGLSIDSLHMIDDDSNCKEAKSPPNIELDSDPLDNICSVNKFEVLSSSTSSHVGRRVSSSKKSSSASNVSSSSNRNTRSQKRNIKNGSKRKSSQNTCKINNN